MIMPLIPRIPGSQSFPQLIPKVLIVLHHKDVIHSTLFLQTTPEPKGCGNNSPYRSKVYTSWSRIVLHYCVTQSPKPQWVLYTAIAILGCIHGIVEFSCFLQFLYIVASAFFKLLVVQCVVLLEPGIDHSEGRAD